MLDIALKFLIDELNTYILTRTDSNSAVVNISKVVDEAGKYAIDNDTVGAAIINIEEERTLKSHLPEYRNINGQHVILEPELKLNLYILIAANFNHYNMSLKYLSWVLTYFQSHPYFTSETYPALDPCIQKLVVELQSLSYEQLNQIWAFIGGKQLPSVVYRVRMVTIQDKLQKAVQPPIKIIQTNLNSQ